MSARAPRMGIRFLSGRLEGGVVPLQVGRALLVGRQPGADLVLAEELVSRRHASVTYDGREVWVEDLGSTNGTFLNGERVTRARVGEGDRVLVGETIFTVASSEPVGAATATQLRPLRRGAGEALGPGSAIQGRLDEVPLADVLQLVATARKTGVLAIRSDSGDALVTIDGGTVVGCSLPGAKGIPAEKALFRIFNWTNGRFDFAPGNLGRDTPRPLAASIDALVMEGARQLDELRRLRASLPRRLAVRDEIPLVALDPEDRTLVDLAGRLGDLQAVLDAVPLTDLAAAERIAALLARGVLAAGPAAG